jgi:hypothetical protein
MATNKSPPKLFEANVVGSIGNGVHPGEIVSENRASTEPFIFPQKPILNGSAAHKIEWLKY